MSNIYTGKIIYWNSTSGYGFIESKELPNTIFFHKSNCSYEDVQFLDNVSFQTSISNSKKHKGKSLAVNINLKERGNLKNYDLRIGVIQNWNGKFGFIDYPSDGKRIILFHTRILYSHKIQNGDLVVFNPIASTKDDTHLFAFFAYHLSNEKDLKFLKNQYENYQIPTLKDYILSISKDNKLFIAEIFELDLINLGIVSTSENYSSLIKLLKRYAHEFNFTPELNLLAKFVPEKYLIQLWESNIINSYYINSIKEYFIRANADTKRLIIQKVTDNDKEIILNNFFIFLQNTNKLTHINNDLKTFLSIIYHSELTRNKILYERVKSYLLSSLSTDELINLWLNDFIDGLSVGFIINNFNIGDKNSVKLLLKKKDENGKPKYEKLISKIYEQYFIEISQGHLNFDQEYPNLVKYLKIYENEFKDKYLDIINDLQKTLTSYQKFVLWILNVNFQFNAISFIENNVEELNHYFRLKFILRYLNEIPDCDIKVVLNLTQIDADKLGEFASNYKWNDLIYPTKIPERKDIHSFLNDVLDYNSKCNKSIDVLSLADIIYNTVEKYNEIHLRLWMHFLCHDNKYYDYVGFHEYFKKLTNVERNEFRNKANERDFGEVIVQEISEVKPCEDFEQNYNESIRTYRAFVENIYFGNGYFKLRLEKGEYTESFLYEYSSTGLNRIPSQHFLNKIPIKIAVKDNKIVQVMGLDELFIQIHTGEIEKALGRVSEGDYSMLENYTYTEDWQLRKQVIDFLNTNQDENTEIKIVNEPKNLYRRLDVTSGIDLFEKTGLFTIKLENELAIIWENIDLSEDRATYIFKCLPENYNKQIQKISDAIASYAQFRSALSSTKDERELRIFKNNFGFITSIRKQRGKNKPFSNWVEKIENALIQPTPKLPTAEELDEIRKWTPNIPHTAILNKSQQKNYKTSAIVRENELTKMDLIEGTEIQLNNELLKKANSINKHKQESILSALKKFNQYFTENLKFDLQ